MLINDLNDATLNDLQEENAQVKPDLTTHNLMRDGLQEHVSQAVVS